MIAVLLLDSKDDGLALVVARCLQLVGDFEVHVLSEDERTSLRHSRRVRTRVDDLSTPALLLAAVERYARGHAVDVIVPVQERMVIDAGRVAAELTQVAALAPIPDPAMTARVDHKWWFHELMHDVGVPLPRTVIAGEDPQGLLAELGSWDSELLTKPSLGWGGRGIRHFTSATEALDALATDVSSRPEDVVIQEYVPGQDVDCSFLALDGEVLAHTTQRAVTSQHHAFGAALGLEFCDVDGVLDVAKGFARATGWSGVAHLDMRLDARSGEPRLIEVNPRYWATLLGSLAMGVNFPELHCRIALGESPPIPTAAAGTWVDYHAMTRNMRNLTKLSRDPRAVLAMRWDHLRVDPHVEAVLLYRNLRHFLSPVKHVLGRRRSSSEDRP